MKSTWQVMALRRARAMEMGLLATGHQAGTQIRERVSTERKRYGEGGVWQSYPSPLQALNELTADRQRKAPGSCPARLQIQDKANREKKKKNSNKD